MNYFRFSKLLLLVLERSLEQKQVITRLIGVEAAIRTTLLNGNKADPIIWTVLETNTEAPKTMKGSMAI